MRRHLLFAAMLAAGLLVGGAFSAPKQAAVATVTLGPGTYVVPQPQTVTTTETVTGPTTTETVTNTVTETVTSTETVTVTAPTTTTEPPPAADVYLSASGDDTTCVRSDPSKPCATFDHAYTVAQAGDTVSVAGGLYAMTEPNYGGTGIYNADGHPVSFTCTGDVTFAGPIFYLWAGAGNITFTGACFRFHVPYIGLGGYSQQTHDVVFDGVHMDSFQISGARDVLLKNVDVGPFVACYGATFTPSYARCDPASPDPNERYWATRAQGSGDIQQEPYIHGNGTYNPTRVTLDGVRIHGISSKWNGTHTGGLLVWTSDDLTIKDSQFDHNAIYDLELNAGSSDSGLTVTGTTFGAPHYSFDPTEPDPGGELPLSWKEGLGTGGTGPGTTATDWLIQGNTIEHGWNGTGLGGTTFTNGQVLDNNMGASPDCGVQPAGVTFSGNTACG